MIKAKKPTKGAVPADGPALAESIGELAEKTPLSLDKLQFDFLSDHQNVFLRAYLMNGRKPLEAYRTAYKNKMSDAAATVEAYRILKHDKVVAALSKIELEARAVTLVTLDDHVRRLRDLGEEARKARQYSAAITAETNVGKASGLYVQRTEITGKDGAPIGVASVPVEEYKRARSQILEDV